MKYRNTGFTLIELMIVVAIVAILASIAYPAYTDSVLKGRRAQARTALMELMQQQERYMTQFNCYLKFTNTAGVIGATQCDGTAAQDVPFKTFAGDNASSASYFLSATECAGAAPQSTLDLKSCILLEATPIRADTEVGTLRFSSSGEKTCSGQTDATSAKFWLCWQ